ncbi:MAG TPA: efflux RND transporter permease subunit [Gemmataceae bacterium]|nr:efflux RND transporter permease subunit [Gemmataceae bacterium]
MFSHFFIERPIFASVMSIVITLAGAVAAFTLPVAQYPQITPPSIIVQCTYPGANAQVVAESVAAPIEQQVNGVEDMIYMASQSANDGSYTLTVTFRPGVNMNFAQVLVQNRVNLALPLLPGVVKQAGVTTRKRNPDILLIVSLYSPNNRYQQLYLSNYATIRVTDELRRVDGVGDVFNFGQQDYSMRIWVDPDKLAEMNLTAADVASALREQNMQVAAGHFGQQPVPASQPFEFTITTLGRLTDPEEFANVVVRSTKDGRKVFIKDIGQVVMGARNQDVTCRIDGHPCTSLAIFQLPYANAIATANRVRDKMEELKKSFPEDVDYAVAYDTTPFVQESINEVFRTLGEAIVLVAIVVLVFLQNWRSTLIPLTAVPVAIIGTFAAMAAIGFSLNNLTLFGLVLAIGIVVDDAIVVVEAVEHHIEEGMSPRKAAHQAMREVSGPVIAVALVLSAVFIPCAFISGITGQFFRQFALTIAVSTIISAFNSLTLSPALAAILLQPRNAKKDLLGRLLDFGLGWFFRLFNWGFRRTTNGYTRVVSLALRGSAIVLLLYGGLLALTLVGFNGLPRGLMPKQALGFKIGSFDLANGLPVGYIPNQDQGKLYVAVQLPDAASLERTQKVVDHIEQLLHQTPGIAHTLAIAGQSFTLSANGSNFGNLFVSLEEFDKRRDPSLSSNAILARLREKLEVEIPEAKCQLFGPPPVAGLGSAGGFKLIVEDRGDVGLTELQRQVDLLIAASKPNPKDPATQGPDAPQAKITSLFSVFRANTPQLYVDLNREQCQTMGVNPNDVFNTLQIYLGSLYVNDFNRFGRTWQVVIQSRGEFRNDPERIKLLKVRNSQGDMVPLGAVLTIREVGGPILIGRYNMYTAAAVVGSTRPDISSGEGIDLMDRLCEQALSPSMGHEWSEINFIQIDAAKSLANKMIFPLAVAFVFLVLAAQYESWTLPLAVILVVPMCILGSLTGVAATHGDVNIFTQIGFVVLVGLASKNAILIVEFAKHRHEAGLPRREATLAACRLRLRPILMTSFAFILGVVPLLIGTGAGAEMRRTLGTAVFSGMLGVTLFGIFLTPVFFFVIEWFSDKSADSKRASVLGRVARITLGVATLGLVWVPQLVRGGLRRLFGDGQVIISPRPRLGGEGSGVRGTNDPRPRPLTPDPSPRSTGARGEHLAPLALHEAGETPELPPLPANGEARPNGHRIARDDGAHERDGHAIVVKVDDVKLDGYKTQLNSAAVIPKGETHAAGGNGARPAGISGPVKQK